MQDRIPKTPPVIPKISDDYARPLWSVMIPAYNCINYIKAAIESVLIQDMGPELMQIELIDDHSTDGDVEQLVAEAGKGRVTYFRQPFNKGSLRNFETCILRSRGQYIHILHGDDLVRNGYYKEITELFNLYPSAGAAFTNYNFIDYAGKDTQIRNKKLLTKKGIINDFLIKIAAKQLVQPPAMTVKRSAYEKLGSFYAVHYGEDWEMWARISSQFPVAYSPLILASYRIAHGIGISHNSILSGQNVRDMKKIINIIQQYIPGGKRKKIKTAVSSHCAVYAIKVANGLLANNREAALLQTKEAFTMSRSPKVLYWTARFYIMYFARYKELVALFAGKKGK